MGRPPRRDGQERSLADMVGIPQGDRMPATARHQSADSAALIGGAIVGGGLAMTGLCFALLAISTPFASRVATGQAGGSTGLMIAVAAWVLAVIAGAGLLFAGTQRLARIVAAVRLMARRPSPMVRAMASLPSDVDVAVNVVPQGGRPIPVVVVGPFGVAVVHDLGTDGALRRVGAYWETRTADGWLPTEHPLDRAARDADRVRHWLNHGDLDFVIRVYAVVITDDLSIARSPVCAVITEAQIPDWIAALPRQRSMNHGRRGRLATLIHGATARP
jgi:hypothetical protein